MHLYITNSDVKIGVSQGMVIVSQKVDDAKIKSYPIEKVESVSVFGKPTLSTTFIREMLIRDISVGLYSQDAHYYGRLVNPDNVSSAKQKLQAIFSLDKKFCLQISKQFVNAKIQNSLSLIKTYNKKISLDQIEVFESSINSVKNALNIESIMGFEGVVAKHYFSMINEILPNEFKFKTRSTRPPLDPFNSMISLGYSMLYRNIIGSIERHGLNAYYGFMHADKEKHASLASDLMEEWRAIIVDDAVLQLIISGEITADEFDKSPKNGGCYAKRDAIRKIVKAFSDRIVLSQSYLEYDDKKYSFQHALDLQLYRFYRALQNENPTYYKSVSCNFENLFDELSSEDNLGNFDDYYNDGLAENEDKVYQKAYELCENAQKGELHTTMIGAIGKLVTAKMPIDKINSFIDVFCDKWGDNNFQRTNYYNAAKSFSDSRDNNKTLQSPLILPDENSLELTIENVLEQNPQTDVIFLVHRTVKYAKGDKKIVNFEKLKDYEYRLRPVVQNFEEGQTRKKNHLLKCITFGHFENWVRNNKNAISRNILLLDYDEDKNGEKFSDERMQEIYQAAQKITQNVILLESVSSQPNARKFHLLFLVKPLNLSEYPEVFRLFDEKMYKMVGVYSDKSCKDIARTMYVGVKYSS